MGRKLKIIFRWPMAVVLAVLSLLAADFALAVPGDGLEATDLAFDPTRVDLRSFKQAKPEPTEPNGTLVFKNARNEVILMRSTMIEMGTNEVDLVSKRAQKFRLLYEPTPSQYPGAISQEISCDRKLVLQSAVSFDTNRNPSVLFNIPANRRFKYGSCFDGDAEYRSQYLILYCKKSKTLFDIKYFYSKSKSDPGGAVAKCRN